jgi:hypothetical protein
MDGQEFLVGMSEMLIQRQGVVKACFITTGTYPLKHGRGVV